MVFQISRGDPLSPYLFTINAECLANKIRKTKNIKGIKVGTPEYKISQYADDTFNFLVQKNHWKNCERN